MIKIEGLTKEYNERKVVDNISFELEEKKVYGFLGPNGAGKSTTMNMLTGYLSPSGGTIQIGEYDMYREPEKCKKLIGYLPEMPPLYLDMTVYEYLDFVCELKGIGNKRKRADEIENIMKKSNTEDVSNMLIKHLSKGYRQRVGIAAALVNNPPILIFDEPTVGLDPKQIVDIRNLIIKLGEEHTVILSTHILSEASNCCDELIIISDGKLVSQDTEENLLAKNNEIQSFELIFKGNSSKADIILNGIEEVDSYSVIGEDGVSCKLKVVAKKGMDVREAVSRKCFEEGLIILELNVKKVLLEDIYLRLTGGDK